MEGSHDLLGGSFGAPFQVENSSCRVRVQLRVWIPMLTQWALDSVNVINWFPQKQVFCGTLPPNYAQILFLCNQAHRFWFDLVWTWTMVQFRKGSGNIGSKLDWTKLSNQDLSVWWNCGVTVLNSETWSYSAMPLVAFLPDNARVNI